MHDFITNLGPILIAATGLLALIGGGLRFVWNKFEKRFTGIETKLEECKARDAEKGAQLSAVVLCIQLLVPEVERLDPDSHANNTLRQVRMILGHHFPIDPHVPADMAALLNRMA